MDYKIGVVGTGAMGLPMIKNMYEDGFNVSAFARRSEVREELESFGIKVYPSLKELAENADVILDITTDTNSTWLILEGEEGILAAEHLPEIFVDMTTSDPNESAKIAEFLEEKGISYMDCPITGGKIGAENRQLVLMAAGEKETYDKLNELFESMSKKTFFLGKATSGHYMKLIHNQLSHSTFIAACEAVRLGTELGMDPAVMIDVFNIGNARSYATEVRFPKFILSGTFNAGASFKTVQKDIGLVMKKIKSLGLEMPITEATYNYWTYPIEHDMAMDDYSKIYSILLDAAKDKYGQH